MKWYYWAGIAGAVVVTAVAVSALTSRDTEIVPAGGAGPGPQTSEEGIGRGVGAAASGVLGGIGDLVSSLRASARADRESEARLAANKGRDSGGSETAVDAAAEAAKLRAMGAGSGR